VIIVTNTKYFSLSEFLRISDNAFFRKCLSNFRNHVDRKSRFVDIKRETSESDNHLNGVLSVYRYRTAYLKSPLLYIYTYIHTYLHVYYQLIFSRHNGSTLCYTYRVVRLATSQKRAFLDTSMLLP